jgi:D-amino-acid oxidase
MSGGSSQKLDAVVLATGLSSKNFLPEEEAEKLYPIRGQTVLVKGEAPKAVTHVFSSKEISYVVPRPGSGTTILGGCKQAGNWDEKEDSHLTERILDKAKVLVPELLGADGEFEVLSVQVGRRPGRRGGPRVEIEKERINAVKVVHAYGHSGAGYQNSIGSAGKVVKLLATQ